MNNYQEIIENLLKHNSHLRDDDLKLVANIWWMTLNSQLKHRFQEYELDVIKTFLEMYTKGDLPNEQSIRRMRRKLQEENLDLRGKVYELRHRKSEEFRDAIISWDKSDQKDVFDR